MNSTYRIEVWVVEQKRWRAPATWAVNYRTPAGGIDAITGIEHEVTLIQALTMVAAKLALEGKSHGLDSDIDPERLRVYPSSPGSGFKAGGYF